MITPGVSLCGTFSATSLPRLRLLRAPNHHTLDRSARVAKKACVYRLPTAFFVLLLSFLLPACSSHKQTRVSPPPPAVGESETRTAPSSEGKSESTEPRDKEGALRISPDAKPLLQETGIASWYGAPYNKRTGSNGQTYNMNAMTAAHRTLPLGSIVRVTNLKTGHSALVRITDRGPFVESRILDLSLAAAKKVDVYPAGLATLRLDLLYTPTPLDAAGRWAVQIGGFEKEHNADKLADHLSRRYHTAKVQCFSSPVGAWWVRVRVQNDDRRRAEEVARTTQTSEGAIFLVRLD
jgi:rare lipoprotein A